MMTVTGSIVIGVGAWFAAKFLGEPILAIRRKRLEALQTAERYSRVSSASSDRLRDTALKALHDVGNALLAYSREGSVAAQAWCYLFRYDLELASRCLFGLAQGPRGECSLDDDQRKLTLNALYVSRGACRHLSSSDVATATQAIEKLRQNRRRDGA
jgi:hypothetical protein